MSAPAIIPLFLAALHGAHVIFPNEEGEGLCNKSGVPVGWDERFDADKVFVTLLTACLVAIFGQLELHLLSWGLALPCAIAFAVHVYQSARDTNPALPAADGEMARRSRQYLLERVLESGAGGERCGRRLKRKE